LLRWVKPLQQLSAPDALMEVQTLLGATVPTARTIMGDV
jgi:hypothetical protein